MTFYTWFNIFNCLNQSTLEPWTAIHIIFELQIFLYFYDINKGLDTKKSLNAVSVFSLQRNIFWLKRVSRRFIIMMPISQSFTLRSQVILPSIFLYWQQFEKYYNYAWTDAKKSITSFPWSTSYICHRLLKELILII